MPSWFDVDAPDTSWRASSEDPIPFLLGRYPPTAFLYRWFACRPLDGHARTDAGFLTKGTKAFSKTGRAMPYQFWPGWKRGLITRLPVTAWAFSWLLAYLVADWHGVGTYAHAHWSVLSFLAHLVKWAVTW